MIATINAVTCIGATTVLVDSEPRVWNIDLNQMQDKIIPRTKLLISVHTYCHPADMDPLMNLAEKHGFAVLEDTAEAHGATHQGRNEPDSAFMRDAMPRLFARTPVARSRSGSVLSLEHRTRACASISLPIHVAKLAP